MSSRRTIQRKVRAEIEAKMKYIRTPASVCVQKQETELETCVNYSLESMFNYTTQRKVDLNLQHVELRENRQLASDVKPKPDKFLCEWALKHNITHEALRDILAYFRSYEEFSNLPMDPRTLLKTPQCVIKFNYSGGECVYFDVKSKIQKSMKLGYQLSELPIVKNLQDKYNPMISIAVGIDGIPISKSSNKQFWPILCSIDQSIDKKVFVAGLFYSNRKPSDTAFLQPFVEKCKVMEKEGIVVNGTQHHFRISRILADAPARSFVKGVKMHNSYEGCERCDQVGEWVGRVVYPFTNSIKLRKDSDFLNRNEDETAHFQTRSIFNQLTIGLVTQVPLDYLHLVCLGVVKKLLRTWVKGKKPYKIRGVDCDLISQKFVLFRKYFPRYFQRKPRSLDEICHFKATEFRTILLYTGMAAFNEHLPRKYFQHFLLLHAACYILLSNRSSEKYWNGQAKRLLTEFVSKCKDLYGNEFITYNIHGLLHLADDSLQFGSLENASTFRFESYMQRIKRILRSNNMYLEQAFKRISEIEIVEESKSKVRQASSPISCKTGGNCYLLSSGEVILVKCSEDRNDGMFKITYSRFTRLQNVREYPIDSSSLGIYCASKLSSPVSKCINSNELLVKYMCLPLKSKFLCIPILHTCEY